jgi:hypothetical protein
MAACRSWVCSLNPLLLGEVEIGGWNDILFWKNFRRLILQSRQGKKVNYRNLITVLIDDVLFVHAFSSIKAGSAKSHGTSSIKTVMRLRYFIFLACQYVISLPLTENHPTGGNWRVKSLPTPALKAHYA